MSHSRPTGRRRAPLPGEQYLSLRPGSSQWQIDITIGGRRLRESSGTEAKEAAAALALKRHEELWREVKLGERPKLELDLEAAFARYYEEVSKGTAYGQRDQRYTMMLLLELLGARTPLSALTDDRISRLVVQLRTSPQRQDRTRIGVSPATVNRYITVLSVVCKRARDVWGAEVGRWDKKKHTLAEPEGREVFLDYDQAKRLLDELCGHARPIVMFDLMTGLRRSNALGIQWEHVSLDLGRAVLIQKGGRPLSVTLVPAAIELLRAVQPDADKRHGPVWTFGNPCTPCTCSHCRTGRFRGEPIKSIKRAFASAVRSAGLHDLPQGRVRFHDLRHTFASWLLAQEGDLKLTQSALGHTRIETTARYAHLLPGRKEAAIAGAVAGLLDAPEAKKEVG